MPTHIRVALFFVLVRETTLNPPKKKKNNMSKRLVGEKRVRALEEEKEKVQPAKRNRGGAVEKKEDKSSSSSSDSSSSDSSSSSEDSEDGESEEDEEEEETKEDGNEVDMMMSVLIPVISATSFPSRDDVDDDGGHACQLWMRHALSDEATAAARASIKKKIGARFTPDPSREAWLGLVSALFYHYDDALLGGRLFSCLVGDGVAIKVRLPREIFGEEPEISSSSRVLSPSRRVLHLTLRASLWNMEFPATVYGCQCIDHVDLIQVAFECQLARIVASLLCGSPEQDRRVARSLLGLTVYRADADADGNRLARLPSVLVAYLANKFLTDKDAVSLASCDVRHFMQLRTSYLCRGFGGRLGPSPFVVGQVTHIDLQKPSKTSSTDLTVFRHLRDVRVRARFGKTKMSDTIRNLELYDWKRSLTSALVLPAHLHSFRVNFESGDVTAGFRWPSSLRSITISGHCSTVFRLADVCFPSKLTRLELTCTTDCKFVVFPRTLRFLSLFKDHGDVPFNELAVPDDVRDLSVFDLVSEANVLWPSALKTLCIAGTIKHIKGFRLPATLEHLTIGPYSHQEPLLLLRHLFTIPLPKLETFTFRMFGPSRQLTPELRVIRAQHPRLRILLSSHGHDWEFNE